MSKTKNFLHNIYGNNYINFRVSGDYTKNLNGYYDEAIIQVLRQFNEQNFEIYYVVNGGGTRKQDINKINAVYIDLDAGKDESGNYYPIKKVQEYKNLKIKHINDFSLKPSYTIDTRNGFHVYWLIQDGATVDQFMDCQKRLIQYFHSDPMVTSPERVMRLPGYYWCKYPEQKYLCDIITENDVRYDINEIINYLPEFISHKTHNSKASDSSLHNGDLNSLNSNLHIEAIRKLDVQAMKNLLLSESIEEKSGLIKEDNLIYQSDKNPIILHNVNELYSEINNLDLQRFIGIPEERFQCILHNDNNPSAHIFITYDGTPIYKCFGCQASLSIIKLIERIADCKTKDAIEFIKKVNNIRLEPDWKNNLDYVLANNKNLLLELENDVTYPHLLKLLRNKRERLFSFFDLAYEVIFDEELIIDGKPLFFASLNSLKGVFKATKTTVNSYITLFCLLGLIDKVPPEKIPESYYEKSVQIAKKNGWGKIVNYFMINIYDSKSLEKFDHIAKILFENHFTMKGLSREYILRTFGQKLADKVFPQYIKENRRGTSRASDKRTKEIVLEIFKQIETNGYAAESRIINVLRVKYGKNLMEIQIKRSIQEILDSYSLLRIRCNKIIKEQYNVNCSGYPYIIVKQ